MLLRGTLHLLNGLTEETRESGAKPEARINRRGFLQTAALAVGGLTVGPAFAGISKERHLTLYAPHTGEMIRMVYWTPDDNYIDDSINEISYVMRDRRSDEVKRIDPALLDQIHALQNVLKPKQPIHMLSGYRSPATNAKLRRTNRGVARASLHMQGMAVDIRMPDRSFNDLYKAALSLKAGGLGRYRRSRFVHLDTGPVRSWG